MKWYKYSKITIHIFTFYEIYSTLISGRIAKNPPSNIYFTEYMVFTIKMIDIHCYNLQKSVQSFKGL